MVRYKELAEQFSSILDEKALGVKQEQIALMLGISQSTVSKIISGEALPSDAVVKAVKEQWGVDIEKSVRRARELAKQATIQPRRRRTPVSPSDEEPDHTNETRPRILTYACAGTLTEAIEEYSEQMPVIAQMPKYDFTIIIRGDSMVPEFRSGDEIACLKVNEKAFVQWGKPHVLFTSQGIVVKRLYEGENGFRCVSDNEQYPEFFVPGDEVYSVNLVVGVIRFF